MGFQSIKLIKASLIDPAEVGLDEGAFSRDNVRLNREVDDPEIRAEPRDKL